MWRSNGGYLEFPPDYNDNRRVLQSIKKNPNNYNPSNVINIRMKK